MAAATTTRTGRGRSPGLLEKDIIDTRIDFGYCFGGCRLLSDAVAGFPATYRIYLNVRYGILGTRFDGW